jgi:SAM-dependent methyltransferase
MLEKITRISQKVNHTSANISEWISPSIFDWSYLTLKPLLSEIKQYSRQLELEETETILDLGCGIKPYISLFPFAKKYIGFDIVAGPEVDVVGKNWELPFRDNEFDALLTTQVLEHTARISETVLEIKRVVKKDGLIFVSAPMTYPEHEVPYDYFRFTRYGLQEIFKDFEIVSITSSGGFIHTMFKLVNVFVNYFPHARYLGAPLFLINNLLGVSIDFCFSILNGKGNATLQKFYDIYMRMPENFMIVIRNTKE